MGLAEGIRKHGFRKWYERELITSHAHLILLLFCMIGVLATADVFSRPVPLFDKLDDYGAIVLFATVGVWSLRRYMRLLAHAEAAAQQAVCSHCQTYGRLVLAQGRPHPGEVIVRCRKCEHEWKIAEG